MQSKILRLTLSCLGAVTLTAGSANEVFADPFLPVPPASFINYHVDTLDQLSQQVAFDAVVRGRLARHFHRSASDVTAYIHDNLVLAHLKRSGQYRVACVTSSGRDYTVREYLKAGTGVFALKTTGQPILKQACGNPLVAELPYVAPKKLTPPQIAKTLSATPTAVPANEEMPSDVTFTAAPPVTAPGTGDMGPFVRIAGVTESLGHGGPGYLPALVGLVGLGAFATHHNSPPPVTPPVVPPLTPPVTPPITPPATPPVIPPVTPPIVPPLTPPVTPPITPPEIPPVTPPVIPPMTPPCPPPKFIGPPPVAPPCQSSVPEPGPVVVFGAGSLVLSVLALRARRRSLA